VDLVDLRGLPPEYAGDQEVQALLWKTELTTSADDLGCDGEVWLLNVLQNNTSKSVE
jgi:hypothetical protein